MTGYATILNPSLTDQEGHSKFLSRLYTNGVVTTLSASSLQVQQRGTGANMSVDIAIGDAHLILPSTAYSYWGWTDAVTNVAVSAADPTNPRVDVVVAYIDPTVTTTASSNSPGAFKFRIFAGTPSGTPVATSDSAIQAALGSSIAWVKLAQIAVAANATSIVTANITDKRGSISQNLTISTQKITDPYKFSIYLFTDTNIVNTAMRIPFDAKTYDTGSNVDIATNKGRFTAPVAGFYFFHLQATLGVAGESTNEYGYAAIYKNGSEWRRGTQMNGSGDATRIPKSTVTGLLQMNAGDYVEGWAYFNGSRDIVNGNNLTFFDGFLHSVS